MPDENRTDESRDKTGPVTIPSDDRERNEYWDDLNRWAESYDPTAERRLKSMLRKIRKALIAVAAGQDAMCLADPDALKREWTRYERQANALHYVYNGVNYCLRLESNPKKNYVKFSVFESSWHGGESTEGEPGKQLALLRYNDSVDQMITKLRGVQD